MNVLEEYFSIFSEGEQDVNFRRQAQDVFRRIDSALKRPDSASKATVKDGDTYYNVGELLNDRSLDDLDLLFSNDDTYKKYNGFFTVDPKPTIIINIGLGKEVSPQAFTGAREAFIHEFVHFLDWKRTGATGKKQFSKDEPASSAEYYNDPFEYNAFFQQAMTSLEEYLSSLPPEKRSQAAQKAMGNSADEFWKKISSFKTGPWPDLIKHLDSKMLTKLKKRVAQSYVDITNSLKSGDAWRKSGRKAALKTAQAKMQAKKEKG